ncbi:accelerated cell death 6-like protein, partial [Tanacetum coccineum]
RLTWTALMSAGTPRGGYKNRKVSKKHNLSGKDEQYKMDHSKDRVNTLLLVATLVATVTFAAGFTMPGGYNNSGPKEGQATLLRKLMLQIFVICDTIALYSSITVAVTLIWAQLGDLTLVVNALRFALPLLSISLTTMSVAFMVGVSLVVESLTWLAAFVLIFGILSLASVLTLFIPLCFPGSSTSPVLRYITYYIFHLLVLASGSSDDRHVKEQ